ncbi:MAG TPA: hypothetical protein VGG60_03805, partial [Candidatus Binataceae bacterium]
LLVAIRGDDGAWAVTDAADGGIADRGGGRGSYRVIAATRAKFCSGHIAHKPSQQRAIPEPPQSGQGTGALARE